VDAYCCLRYLLFHVALSTDEDTGSFCRELSFTDIIAGKINSKYFFDAKVRAVSLRELDGMLCVQCFFSTCKTL